MTSKRVDRIHMINGYYPGLRKMPSLFGLKNTDFPNPSPIKPALLILEGQSTPAKSIELTI